MWTLYLHAPDSKQKAPSSAFYASIPSHEALSPGEAIARSCGGIFHSSTLVVLSCSVMASVYAYAGDAAEPRCHQIPKRTTILIDLSSTSPPPMSCKIYVLQDAVHCDPITFLATVVLFCMVCKSMSFQCLRADAQQSSLFATAMAQDIRCCCWIYPWGYMGEVSLKKPPGIALPLQWKVVALTILCRRSRNFRILLFAEIYQACHAWLTRMESDIRVVHSSYKSQVGLLFTAMWDAVTLQSVLGTDKIVLCYVITFSLSLSS